MNFDDLLRSDPSIVELIRNIRLVVFDFDGVFTDNMVYVSEDGTETVRCCRGDGEGIRRLRSHDLELVVISAEINPVVSVRTRKLNIACIQGCGDKVEELQRLCRGKKISLDQVAYVGNDINDLGCLKLAGLPVVVSDAHPDVMPLARYVTEKPGGCGAVREFCDLFEWVYNTL